MYNHVTLIGRLTKEPELRITPAGKSVCTIYLAVNRRFKREGQPEADFFRCVAWGATADNIAKYLAKGSLAAVDGTIQNSNYEDKNGQKRSMTEIMCNTVVFLTPKSATTQANDFYTGANNINDDPDLPF